MGVETSNDRLNFLNIDEFGVDVVLKPNTGTPTEVRGIFDSPAVVADGSGQIVQVSDPVLHVRTEDVAKLDQQDQIKIKQDDSNFPDGPTTYQVKNIMLQDDGLFTLLELYEV
jgi:hypothetical protein